MRNLVATVICLSALVDPLGTRAQVQSETDYMVSPDGIRMIAREVEVRARVAQVDRAQRTIELRGARGRSYDFVVPGGVKNFDQVKVGDELTVRYRTAVAVKLEPVADRSGIRERVESTAAAVAASGAMPGAAEARMVEVLAIVESLNHKERTATLRGVKDRVTLDVPAAIDMAKLKPGDEVRAVFVEQAVVAVERNGAVN